MRIALASTNDARHFRAMTSRPTWSLVSLTSIAALAGCPSPTATPDAARASDAFVTVDVFTASDAFTPSPDALASIDAGPDTFVAPDAGMPDAAAGCTYDGIDEVVVKCGGAYRFATLFRERGMACPDFYSFTPEGPRFASYAEVIASDATCDARCIYDFAISVSRVYCGRRTGYERLTATGCADIYRFSEGTFDSVESHDAMYPCPPVP